MAYQQQPAQQSYQPYHQYPYLQNSSQQPQYTQSQAVVDSLAKDMSTMSISSRSETNAMTGTNIIPSPAGAFFSMSQRSTQPTHTHLREYEPPQPQQQPKSLPQSQYVLAQTQYQVDGRQYDPSQFSSSQPFTPVSQRQIPIIEQQPCQNQHQHQHQNQNQLVQTYAPQDQHLSGQRLISYQSATCDSSPIVYQSPTPSSRHSVPVTQLQSQTVATGMTYQSFRPPPQTAYPHPSDTLKSRKVQQNDLQNVYPPPHHTPQVNSGVNSSVFYSTPSDSIYPQNESQTPISAANSPTPSQKGHSIHIPKPTHLVDGADARSVSHPWAQMEEEPTAQQLQAQYGQNINQNAPPIQYTPATTYPHSAQALAQQLPRVQQLQQQQTHSFLQQMRPSDIQPANSQSSYATQPTNLPQNNHYYYQTFPPPPLTQTGIHNNASHPVGHQLNSPPLASTQLKAPIPPSSMNPKFSAQASIHSFYTKSKPAAEKVGSALGKGYHRTSKFLASSNGKKVMAGTAGLLVAGFIGVEAGDILGGAGGAEALAGGGAETMTSGGDYSAMDPQASQAYYDMAQQGQINSMSLIDDTQYELVPAI